VADDTRTQIVLLGTGTPVADPDRSGPCVAIVVDDEPYLVDAGPGLVRRASAAHQQGVAGLGMKNLKRLFLTHLHSDHTLGLPDLIYTPWILGREDPLEVYGPPGTQTLVDHIVVAYAEDTHLRIEGLEDGNRTGHKVIVHEIRPGDVYCDERVRVTAFPVQHGSWEHAYGFRFETPERTIVVSGDTVPVDALVEAARGCDVLIHEVYSVAGWQKRPPDSQRYHRAFHTSTRELAEIARQVQPGLLILYHQLFFGVTEDELVQEMRSCYDGAFVSGDDLDVY
jgi:ribonuclease BN (tRNA processing enzyme)